MIDVDAYREGYAVGYLDGKDEGYTQGYHDASTDYDIRISKYWAELQTLNARISYLEKQLGDTDGYV